MKKNQDTFRNSELDRVREPLSSLKAFINSPTKRHRSDTGQVEDRTSSVTIVRIIVGLLMVHLIVIGGVLLRGKMVKAGNDLSSTVSITPPPAPPATEAQPPARPATPQHRPAHQQQKLSIVAATPQAPAAPQQARVAPVVAPTHITQAPETEETAEEPEVEPVVVEAVPAVPATPQEAPVEPLRHKVAPGDTIYRIAHQYNTTEAALRAANPTTLGQGMLRAGTTLEIPTAGQSAPVARHQAPTPARPTPAAPATPQQATTTTPKVYTVKRGETLSGIARKTKVSVPELIRLNGLKDANRIHPGMQLRLSK